MRQRENGDFMLLNSKMKNFAQHQLRRHLLVRPLCHLFAYRLTFSISVGLVSPDVIASLGGN